MTPPHPAKPKADAAEVLRERLRKAIVRAEDWAGTEPAKTAVKLRPSDWHAVTKAARELITAPAVAALAVGPSDEITSRLDQVEQDLVAFRTERNEWRERAEAAEARNKVLEETLRPFALWGAVVLRSLRATAPDDDAVDAGCVNMLEDYELPCIGDLRRARAALSQDRTEVSNGGE